MKIKKVFVAALSLLLALGVAAGCGNEKKDAKSEQGALAKIKAAGEIKIGTEGTYAPFSYHDKDKKLTGFDVEVAEAIAKKLGVKPVFVETKWDSMIAGLDAGRFDTVANQVSVTDERKKKFDFSTPYIYIHETLMTKKENNTIKSMADVKGRKLAQTVSSNFGKDAEKAGATLVPVEGFQQAVDLVTSGRAEGTLNTDVVLADYLKQKPDTDLKVAYRAKESTVCALPVKKGNEDLLKAINQALDELKKDGTLAKISQKYFGKDMTVDQ